MVPMPSGRLSGVPALEGWSPCGVLLTIMHTFSFCSRFSDVAAVFRTILGGELKYDGIQVNLGKHLEQRHF